MYDKSYMRSQIIDFFKDKKLNKNSYYKAWYEKYKNGIQVYDFIANYYNNIPALSQLPLGQKIYHIVNDINYIPDKKFISFKRGYVKGGVTFSGKSIKTFINKLDIKQYSSGFDMPYNEISTQLLKYIKRSSYTSLLNDTNLLYNVFKHTKDIKDIKLKFSSLCNDSIHCLCGKYCSFKNDNTFYLNSTCGDKKCISSTLSDKIKGRDLSYLQSNTVKRKRVESRKGYRHSNITKKKISVSNKITWTDEKKTEQTNINRKNGVYKKSSETMHRKILSGEYTPNTNNRYTHNKLASNKTGINTYRSSWEVKFHETNPHLEYETVRIPYKYKGESKVYIVDFCDQKKKILYEVKPSEFLDQPLNKVKFKAARSWCAENNYKFSLITEKQLCKKI